MNPPASSTPQAAAVAAESDTSSAAGPIRYLGIDPPVSGSSVIVAANVRWSRVPLPLDLNHINVWLIGAANGYVLVDTGMAATMCRDAWTRLHAELFETNAPRAVFVTHGHADHSGLAEWLQQRYSIPVWLSRRCHAYLESVQGGPPALAEIEAFLRARGVVEPAELSALLKPERYTRLAAGMPRVERFIEDEARLELEGAAWQALEVEGHADGHLCLWNADEGILISGDQVLPAISPNISISFRDPEANPLHAYLRSLERLRRLPADTLVLPSHGLPFYGLHRRIDDLRAHHERQLLKLVEACSRPLSAREVLPVLYRRKPTGMHLLLALGEATAHLEYLARRGDLERGSRGDVVVYARASQ
jgi:glyoxylase-like metal-dependent hydrolase (beta-lactamase superfamily II)